MTDFDALLRRSFAEAHEPTDDGFSVKVGHAVARRESAAKARGLAYALGMAAAATAVIYGVSGMVLPLGQELLASAGLEMARAHGAISSAPSISGVAQGVVQSLGAGMTQILLLTAALAGGAVAYRVTRD